MDTIECGSVSDTEALPYFDKASRTRTLYIIGLSCSWLLCLFVRILLLFLLIATLRFVNQHRIFIGTLAYNLVRKESTS